MFLKMLKYDLLNLWSRMKLWYLSLISLGLLIGVTSKYFSNSFTNLITSPLMMAFVLIMISIIFTTLFMGVSRINTTITSREGYLMNTLPIEKSTFLLSKYTSFSIILLSTILVMICAITLLMLDFSWISSTLSFMNQTLGANDNYFIIILFFLLIFLSILYYYFMFSTSIILGQRKGFDKNVQTFISFVLIYIANQIVSSIAIFIYMIIDTSFYNSINNGNIFNDQISKLLILANLLYVVFMVVTHIIMNRTLQKNLNIQ